MKISNINEAFCERILQTHQKDKNIQVLEIKKSLATSEGDNYLSEIYRILVKYNEQKNGNPKSVKETSLIVKTKLPDLVSGVEFIDEAFRNEIYMLTKVLPRIEEYIGCSISPFTFYGEEGSNYIVMEDLGEKRYANGNRIKGLSLEHCLIAVEQLAKFHAGSVAVMEREPDLIKDYIGVCRFTKLPENYFKFVRISLEKLSDTIEEKWKEEEYLEIASKLRKLNKTIKTQLASAFECDANEFCVLNHGDFWTNNIMFKHNEEGKPCDAVLVDFQLITYTSPAIDLQHFLAMCPELDVLGDKDDYILETYLTILKITMKKIGCETNPPTMEQLKKAIVKRGVYSVLTGLIYYPRIIADKTEVESFNEVMKTGETSMDIFKNPLAARMIKKFSKIIKDRGYLD